MDNEFLYEMDELMNEGKFSEVVEKIRELDEEELGIELHLMLAHALSQCAKYHEAISTLKDIEEETSDDDIGYHLEMAGALFGLHHYRAAVKEAKTCIEIDETCVEPWLLLCLVYQETGEENKFDHASQIAKELDEDAWNNIFGDRSDELEFYSENDACIVAAFISKHFGRIADVLAVPGDECRENPHSINCLIIKPDETNDFYKLVSVGIGAYSGTDKNTGQIHRIEMAAFLPSYYSMDDIKEKFSWIAKIMRQFGEMLQFEKSWLAAGHSISYGEPMDESVGYNGVIFNDVFVDTPYRDKCILENNEEVSFLRIIPLYEEEMMYKINNGHNALFNRLVEKLEPEEIDVIIPERPNSCAAENGGKKWAIPRSSIEQMIEWNGADGCYATDKITVDGFRVGFMIREKPDNDKFDSGWRFFAGNEDDEYMSDVSHSEIFSLNTICNFDPDIIEYLEKPVGSAYYRDSSGVFRRYKNRG